MWPPPPCRRLLPGHRGAVGLSSPAGTVLRGASPARPGNPPREPPREASPGASPGTPGTPPRGALPDPPKTPLRNPPKTPLREASPGAPKNPPRAARPGLTPGGEKIREISGPARAGRPGRPGPPGPPGRRPGGLPGHPPGNPDFGRFRPFIYSITLSGSQNPPDRAKPPVVRFLGPGLPGRPGAPGDYEWTPIVGVGITFGPFLAVWKN